MKNLKGGYQLVDLQGNDLSSGFTLEGLHQVITLSNNKPLLVTGIVIGGIKKNDVYTTAEKTSDKYTFTIYDKTLTIANDDSVTVANETTSVAYLTEAPTSDNTNGLIFVVLDTEPDTYYNGYYYIITE